MSRLYREPEMIQLQGELFWAVQMKALFPDSKLFVDLIPKSNPTEIKALFKAHVHNKDFCLKSFVIEHFEFPLEEKKPEDVSDIDEYLSVTWNHLARTFTYQQHSTSISLPRPHIVPGGRFRECYYWDSYFIALGLEVQNRLDIIEDMIKNFGSLIDRYGHIPNGNRVYYLSRSQQPVFSLLLELFSQKGGDIAPYFLSLQTEYTYWTSKNRTTKIHGYSLQRYYDEKDTPREEGYKEDAKMHLSSYRDIRAACESGWDFSSRWLKDNEDFSSIQTTRLAPVDLNTLLWHMESTLSHLAHLNGYHSLHKEYLQRAQRRKEAINTLFWNEKEGFYYDVFFDSGVHSSALTLAGLYPLFLSLAPKEKADRCLDKLKSSFLAKGGLKTTLNSSSQQWDGSNGWAPLQWVGFKSAQNYGYDQLAFEIAHRWLALNEKIFALTKRFVEKYEVETLSINVQDGEYTLQEGFGWTNGVYLKLKDELQRAKQ